MNLLSSQHGHLTNLSGKAVDTEGHWHVNLFPSASDPLGRQGYVRMTNRSEVAGVVNILAYDDTDTQYEPVRFPLDPGVTADFNSDDLELGNPDKGLAGSTGAGTGAWRLILSSDTIDFDAYFYLRASDGLLTTMHEEAPRKNEVHRVAYFNHGDNALTTSVLRLVNPSARPCGYRSPQPTRWS